jgi:hypothetical protein
MPAAGTLYVPSHITLGSHPKLIRLARRLGVSRAQAVGHLHYFWWWAMTYAPNGQIDGFSAEEIAVAAEWDADPDLFVCSMAEVGFIDGTGIHDWPEYGGKVFAQRQKNTEKVAQFRQNQQRNRYVPVTEPLRNGIEIDIEREREVLKPPIYPPKQDVPKPPRKRESYSPEFEVFWSEYPRGHGTKAVAWKQWKLVPRDDHAAVFAGLRLWKTSERWQQGYVKAAEIWLRDRWWENDPPPPRPKTTANGSANGRTATKHNPFWDDVTRPDEPATIVETTGRTL